MKNLVLFTLAILLSTITFSQSRKDTTEFNRTPIFNKVKKLKQHRISLNFGRSNPLGDFSENDQYSDNSGYADGSLSIGISYQYRVHESFLVSLLYGSTANKFKAQVVENQLSSLEPRLRWRVEADPYSVRYFMVGAKGYIGDEVKGYINPMFGYGIMIAPQVNVVASDGTNSASQLLRESDPAGSTVLGVSFGIDFMLSEVISINIDGTYLTSEFDIEQVFDTFDLNGNVKRITRIYDQPYEVLNFSLGLGLHF